MDLLEKACTVVAETQHRYMHPDPLRPLAIGDYGRVKNGVLSKRGSLQSWLDAKRIALPAGLRISSDPTSTEENAELASRGVRKSAITLQGELSAAFGHAKVGFKLDFSRDDQIYFHVPGLRFNGMHEHGAIGDALVACALLEDHDPKFWEDDYCVVTGVYHARSCLQVFAEGTSEEVSFTAEGAASIQDLYKAGAKLGFTTQSSSSTVLKRTYHSSDGQMGVFYEMHKVHWDVWGNKWWNVVEDANP